MLNAMAEARQSRCLRRPRPAPGSISLINSSDADSACGTSAKSLE
jgi:hypothetical protein